MDNIDVGIVILNYNCAEDTLKCKKVIVKSIRNLKYKIFIVDNPSKEEERNILRNSCHTDNTELILAEINGGYSYGNNLGIERALKCGCKNILIINPDVIVKKNAIERMNEALNNSPNVVMIGPKVLDFNRNIDVFAQRFLPHTLKMCIMLKYPFSKLNFGGSVSRYFMFGRNFELTEEIFTTSGCCVMFKDLYFKEFGLFDEDFFMFSEEVVWGKNILDSNKYYAQYLGSAEIIHNHQRNLLKTKPYVLVNRMLSDLTFCRKYLRCKKSRIYPLLLYYTLAFDVFCIKDREYIKYRKEFRSKMKSSLAKFDVN